MSTNRTMRQQTTTRGCGATCPFGQFSRDHHDRLLRVEHDLDGVLDLMELAVTWGELDYSGSSLIPPMQWSSFVDSHQWRDRDRVRRIFDLATDVALRADVWAVPVPSQGVRSSVLQVVEV